MFYGAVAWFGVYCLVVGLRVLCCFVNSAVRGGIMHSWFVSFVYLVCLLGLVCFIWFVCFVVGLSVVCVDCVCGCYRFTWVLIACVGCSLV